MCVAVACEGVCVHDEYFPLARGLQQQFRFKEKTTHIIEQIHVHMIYYMCVLFFVCSMFMCLADCASVHEVA